MTPEYHSLCKRIARLQRHLLPKLSSTGSYTDAEYDGTRAYIALVHAEIESFLEKRCKDVAAAAKTRWFVNRSINGIIFSVYTMCYSGWAELEGDSGLPKLSKKTDVEDRITSSIQQYTHVVDSNHGIKEKYLKKLLVPLSIRLTDLDPNWIIEMSNFGGLRGQIVHMSGKTRTPPDPAATRHLIRTMLLPGLNDLDKRLTALVTSIGPLTTRMTLRERVRGAFRLLWCE